MKKTLKIIGRTVLALFIALFVSMAFIYFLGITFGIENPKEYEDLPNEKIFAEEMEEKYNITNFDIRMEERSGPRDADFFYSFDEDNTEYFLDLDRDILRYAITDEKVYKLIRAGINIRPRHHRYIIRDVGIFIEGKKDFSTWEILFYSKVKSGLISKTEITFLEDGSVWDNNAEKEFDITDYIE